MPEVPSERQRLAEQWRQLGEKLRRRSPAAFEKLLTLLAASAIAEDPEDELVIDEIYPYH